MSAVSSVAKKRKLEEQEEYDDDDGDSEESGGDESNGEDNRCRDGQEEEEEALVALIGHRTKEAENLKRRITYYQKQLAEVEKRLRALHHKLARVRGQYHAISSKGPPANESRAVSEDHKSKHLVHAANAQSKSLSKFKSELLTSAPDSKSSGPVGSESIRSKTNPATSGVEAGFSRPKVENHRGSFEKAGADDRGKRTKVRLEQREHKELIPLIGRSSSACKIQCHSSNQISSQHKRKLRCLVLCPQNDQLFVTSSLDGMVKLWQLQPKGMSASLLSSTDCLTPKQRRWPEETAFHPLGNSLFSVYTADPGDSQISILNLNKSHGRSRVTFLEDRPHGKGIINSIKFMPWQNTCFATGGSDHAVVLWSEKDEEDKWVPKTLHRNLHSAAVMGVSGMQNKNIVLSVGADKRILGFDVRVGRADFKHQIEYKCMSVLANPIDFNLFMVQSGEPEKQLRLFDIRLRRTELHCFGWKQDSSESQSALINQSWSPDGLYVTSGSADPTIHIFDIRYNSRKPSQSMRAHEKRVFKAEWHHSLPLLISISSDLNIGFHKVC